MERLTLGITGGIGSGKSQVCRILSILGIPVFNADMEARQLYNDQTVRQQIVELWGPDTYANHLIQRDVLANLVFKDPKKLQTLQNIIHPKVQQVFQVWRQRQKTDYVVKEAALFIEAGSYREVDYLAVVLAPLSLRIERTMKRDHVSYDQVMERIQHQTNDEERIKHAHFLLRNDEQELLTPQVLRLHHRMLQMAEQFKLP